ncbi:MAG: HAMP domain-containing sensor histidine kinase [Schaedlerella sp.]|nr:HAMP domain-containing sensor histidine kinase [Schaedlerella sp.]
MKLSIRRQLLAIFLGLIIFMVGIVTLINTTFLEDYYVSDKMDYMVEMYETLDNGMEKNLLYSEEFQNELERMSKRANISVTVVDQSGNPLIYTENEQSGSLQLFGYLVGKNQGELLETTEEFKVYKVDRRMGGSQNLEMYGRLTGGAFFLMQSPIQSIKDSVALTNRFLLYVGFIAVILGTIFVGFFANRITKPIRTLTALSQRMADLDFDARYEGGGNYEIEVLGENFNTMSRQLENTITELKSANQRLQRDIEQKERTEDMRSEFLGNVSHELKTPIALIQGYAEGLKEGISDDPESREFYCDVIMDEANKMNQMVKNLLTLNQLEFGTEKLEVARFDLVKLIQGVIASCEILIQQAGADVRFYVFRETEKKELVRVLDEMVYVWADEFKTEQIIRNYLTNAIHHVSGKKLIEIRVIQKEDTVRTTVFNTGTPIPEEDLAKIWDKFYKVDKAHTRAYGGNGIGLSIVKAIMESFHQEYGVINYDNGVKFYFELDANNNEL